MSLRRFRIASHFSSPRSKASWNAANTSSLLSWMSMRIAHKHFSNVINGDGDCFPAIFVDSYISDKILSFKTLNDCCRSSVFQQNVVILSYLHFYTSVIYTVVQHGVCGYARFDGGGRFGIYGETKNGTAEAVPFYTDENQTRNTSIPFCRARDTV